MRNFISATLFISIFSGCLTSEEPGKNRFVGEWNIVSYTARYMEDYDTSSARPLDENEWKFINHDPNWYSNIRILEIKDSTFYLEHVDSSDSNSSKVESHEGVYKVKDGKLWLTFYAPTDKTTIGYPPLEIGINSIEMYLCYKNYTGSGLMYVPSYGKCLSTNDNEPIPKKSIEVAISIQKSP